MYRAIWKNTVLAESNETVKLEGNHYFPPDTIKREFLKSSATHTTCGWKGVASYYNAVVDGEVNSDCAWFYPDPKDAAKEIAGHVAFWRGVVIEED